MRPLIDGRSRFPAVGEGTGTGTGSGDFFSGREDRETGTVMSGGFARKNFLGEQWGGQPDEEIAIAPLSRGIEGEQREGCAVAEKQQ